MSLAFEIAEVALEIGKFVMNAIISEDKQWQPIAELLPAPLKSRLERIAQDAKTEEELRKVLQPLDKHDNDS